MEYKQNPLIDDFLVITNTTDRLKASEFLKNSSNDLNKAIQLFFEKGADFFKIPNKPSIKKPVEDLLAKKYEQFLNEKEKNKGFFGFSFNIFKNEYDELDNFFGTSAKACDDFKKVFSNKYHQNFKIFQNGRISENLLKAHKSDKILMILLFSSEESIEKDNFLSNLFKNSVISIILEKNYMVVGISDMKETNKIMQEFPPTKEMPCFLLLTMNILEKPSIVGYMPVDVSQPDSYYIDKLKENITVNENQKKHENSIKSLVEASIKQRKNQPFNQIPPPSLFWNPFFDPMSNNLYSEGDFYQPQSNNSGNNHNNSNNNRAVTLEQNEEYERALQLSKDQFNEKMKQDKLEAETRIKEEEETRKIEERRVFLEEKFSKQDVAIANDAEIMTVLFRFGNGKKADKKFLKNQKIEDFFDFVEFHEIQEKRYNFDLIITYPFLSLSTEKFKQISEVFKESNQETIQIKKLE